MEGENISSKLTAQLIREASERKHAEALIDLFVKNAPGAVAVLDSGFRYRSVSDKWYHQFNLDHVDIVSESILDLTVSFRSSLWQESFRRALSGEHLRGKDQLLKAVNGQADFWVNWEILPWSNKDGVIAGLVFSMEVLNEKKQLVNDLKKTHEIMQLAVHASGMGFWQWTDVDDKLDWDDGMFRIFEVNKNEFSKKGEFFFERIHSLDKTALLEKLEAALKSKGEYHTKYRIETSKGIRTIKEHGKVFDEKGYHRVTGICEDITEEEQMKSELKGLNHGLERKIQERTKELKLMYEEARSLTYSISHDLRAPLNAISGYVQVIKEDTPVPLGLGIVQYFDRIDVNAKKVLRLIDDLLAFSRVIHQKLRFERIEAHSFFDSILSEFDAASASRVRVGEIPSFFADATTMRQAFYNLIDNALKFSKKDVVVNGEVHQGQVEISVTDQGVGFSMENFSKIFEMFRKLHPESQYGGSGIGLSLTRRILEINNSKITAESAIGKGTRFCISIPSGG